VPAPYGDIPYGDSDVFSYQIVILDAYDSELTARILTSMQIILTDQHNNIVFSAEMHPQALSEV
jgi:hypothetical protein